RLGRARRRARPRGRARDRAGARRHGRRREPPRWWGPVPHRAADAGAAGADPDRESDPGGVMRTVLVIDDDQAVRRFLRTVLSGQGYTVVEAGSVAEGIDQLRRARPDVVLLDLGLPDGDGTKVLAAIPPEDPRTPVIVLSARGQEGDKVVALDSGAD